jgi:hypothetical protein
MWLILATVLRRRLGAPVVVALLAASGAAVAAGALLLQTRGAGPVEWAVAVGFLSFVAPAHARIVFGPFGPGAPQTRPWAR